MPELPIQEVAARIGVHPATIRRRITAGSLPARQDGQGRYLVSLSDAEGLLGKGGGSEVDGLRDEIEELRRDLVRATEERDQYRERFERAYANYERLYDDARADRERAGATERAQLELIRDLQAQLLELVRSQQRSVRPAAQSQRPAPGGG